MDNAGTQSTKPEVFYTGKHPWSVDFYESLIKLGEVHRQFIYCELVPTHDTYPITTQYRTKDLSLWKTL